MQSKRKKRSRIRAAKVTAGHGHKKKNRGAGHRGGRGKSGAGKRGDFKYMKVTGGVTRNTYLGKHGFKSKKSKEKAINLYELQNRIQTLLDKGMITKTKDIYEIDLNKLGYQKLLSKGKVKNKLIIRVDAATNNAVTNVREAGGEVKTMTLEEKQ